MLHLLNMSLHRIEANCLHVRVFRHNKFATAILKEMGIQRVLEIQWNQFLIQIQTEIYLIEHY